MLSVSSLIDFLMNLMRDDDARAAFADDPQGELTRNGLDGVSAQDIRDARLVMADDGGVRPTGDHRPSPGGDDPVREIHHTTNNYVVDKGHSPDIDQTVTLVNIDDRDTVIVDSFNSNDNNDIDVVAVQDNSQNTDVDIDLDASDEGSDASDEGAGAGEVPDGSDAGDEVGDGPTAGIDPVVDRPIVDGPFDDEQAVQVEPVPDGADEPFDPEPDLSIQPVDSEPVDDEPQLDAAVV